MAETPIQNDVFRFLAMRPPRKARRKLGSRDTATIADERKIEDTPVGKMILGLGQESSIERVVPLVEGIVEEKGWSAELEEADERLRRLALAGRVAEEHARLSDEAGFSGRELGRDVFDALGEAPAAFARGGRSYALRAEVWDRLHAFYILNRHTPVNLEALTGALRALEVAEHMEAGERFETVEELRALLRKPVVLPEPIVRIAPGDAAPSGRAVERDERDAAERERLSELWGRYLELHQAADELQQVRPVLAQVSRETGGKKAPAGADAKEAKRELHTREFRREARVAPATLNALSAPARRAMDAVGLQAAGAGIPEALGRVHQELSLLSEELFKVNDPRLSEVMPEEARALPAAMALQAKNDYEPALTKNPAPSKFPYPWVLRPTIRPLGIGDLKVVKQKLERYVAGEVAHIENVLQGESKERKHRRFDRSEDTITVARETAEETERDTQTTDRFELKKEAERTIQTDLSVEAGVTVSASYGPVELGAHANFAYSQSTTDTTRTSSNFARDVVDRSVTRIQKRTREERVTRTIHEVEEVNTHGLDNEDGAGHITGVYRWVDKHYQAQLYNYGRRMMFEFIVPEPAAFFIHSQTNNPSKAITLEKPRPLGGITHKSITEYNYQNYIRDYHVQGVTPPPPAYRVLGLALEQSGMQENQTSSKANRELVVPDGYTATWWRGRWTTHSWEGSAFDLLVGSGTDLVGEDMVLPVGIKTFDVAAYAVVIEVYCTRTARAYEQWQISTFEKIMAAYQSAMAQYEDKLRAAEARRGVVITGQNPAINREIERNELKKHSVTMLTGERYQRFDAMSGTPPEIDLVDAAAEGRFVQFFEQAFEWEQMTYLFYPYFWGRKSNWVPVSTRFDNDPMFTRFLQAGYARVVVPVHPAYNDAILYYLQTGALWNGGDAPVLDDPLYIALYQELKDQQDDLGNAVPEGTPWKVVLPTTLVWLQPGPQLPDFTSP